jgi:hypothetical protein
MAPCPQSNPRCLLFTGVNERCCQVLPVPINLKRRCGENCFFLSIFVLFSVFVVVFAVGEHLLRGCEKWLAWNLVYTFISIAFENIYHQRCEFRHCLLQKWYVKICSSAVVAKSRQFGVLSQSFELWGELKLLYELNGFKLLWNQFFGKIRTKLIFFYISSFLTKKKSKKCFFSFNCENLSLYIKSLKFQTASINSQCSHVFFSVRPNSVNSRR